MEIAERSHSLKKEKYIEVKNISKSFNELKAVNNISFSIHAGEYVALLGPNGAGKTTMVEMIEGLQQPDSGEIVINGKTWKNHEEEIHALLGISLQETKFIDKLSVIETLQLFGSFYGLPKSSAEEAMHLVGLESKRKSFTVTLSGGQRQKLALAIALLNNPKILLLDEPTTGLDPAARREIWEILKNLKKKATTSMILTTHYLEEAEVLCDRIIIMDKGSILAQGTLAELIKKHGEGDTIHFTLNKKTDLFPKGLNGAKDIIWEIPGKKGRILTTSGTDTLPAFFRELEKQKASCSDLSYRKTTLDDLFIQMTGRKLNE